MKLIKKILASLLILQSIFPTCTAPVKSFEYQLCEGFTSEKVPADIEELVKKNSCIEDERNDFVRIGDLRYLKIKHWGFDEKEHTGEMLVNESIAEEVLRIFKELYNNKFPIYQMMLIEHYGSDDEASMSENNTSCLRISSDSMGRLRPWHALGLAIDINPLNNPCIYPEAVPPEISFVPHNAGEYLDRSNKRLGMIDQESICFKIFKKYGWEYGGEWTDPIDLHHFQKFTWTTVFPRKYKK